MPKQFIIEKDLNISIEDFFKICFFDSHFKKKFHEELGDYGFN